MAIGADEDLAVGPDGDGPAADHGSLQLTGSGVEEAHLVAIENEEPGATHRREGAGPHFVVGETTLQRTSWFGDAIGTERDAVPLGEQRGAVGRELEVPLVPRCELKYNRFPFGENAGPVISELSCPSN